MRFGSTAKVLLKCKLKYYRISEWFSLSAVQTLLTAEPHLIQFETRAESP